MKIFVLNVHRHRHIFTAVKIIALMLAFATLFFFVASSYTRSDKYVSAMQDENEKSIIILDAGHGGEDPGAISKSGIYEKDLNLEISNALKSALEERGFSVIQTRTDDRMLYTESENIKGIRKISDLKNRCKIAAEYPNAIFVSIHMNSYGDSKYSGLQVYYGEKSDTSYALASSIQNNVAMMLQNDNKRVIKPGKNMYLMENVENTGVLIECGFLSNPEECKKLSEKEYQKQLSLAIVCGIIEYKESLSQHK